MRQRPLLIIFSFRSSKEKKEQSRISNISFNPVYDLFELLMKNKMNFETIHV